MKTDHDYQWEGTARACACIGPQHGQPCCPCKMRNIKIVDGRYVQVIDYGPAPSQQLPPGNYRVVCDELFRVESGPPCFFDGLDPDKIYGLACPCPKCSPRC